MKSTVSTLALGLLLSAALTPAVFARDGTRDPGVNARQHHQHDRIQQGVRSGELSREEAQTLRGEQRDIRREERRDKADGVLTGRERRELHRELNEASQNIHEEKHDAEKR